MSTAFILDRAQACRATPTSVATRGAEAVVALAIDRLPPDAPLVCASAGLYATPHLPAFVGGRPVLAPGARGAGFLGWGRRRSGRVAEREAGRAGAPFALLEDGFIRSVGLGKAGAATVSLVADDQGVYYDARSPSRLEDLLARSGWETAALLARATAGRARWQAERLSKYNVGADRPAPFKGVRIVLVDQVVGDASISGAGADSDAFSRMLETALAAYAASDLIVRTHPDVAAGRAQGFLTARARRRGVEVVAEDLSPHALLDAAAQVWTVSSGLGFEALLRGVPVTTFGAPFYAGWGLTDDRATGSVAEAARRRRGQARTQDEIFAAAFLLYARYGDPVTRRALTFEQAVDRLCDWRSRHAAREGRNVLAFGFSIWKQKSARAHLGPVRFAGRARASAVRRAPSSVDAVAVWGMPDAAGFREACAARGLPLLRVEDGFLRSVGLGSDFVPAGSLVVDDIGVHYDARGPSRLETMLQTRAFTPDEIARAAALRARIVADNFTKYNLGGRSYRLRELARGRDVVLVAGQVPGDAALRYGGGGFEDAAAFLRAVRDAEPDAFLVYKEHPDLVAGNRRGRERSGDLRRRADLVVAEGDMAGLMSEIDRLHVVSSLAGFEALLRGVRVTTWGQPFYAGWGLTRDRMTFARRTRRLTLDELVAGALLFYPSYADPASGVPCSPEDYLEALAASRSCVQAPPPEGAIRRLRRAGRWSLSLLARVAERGR